MNRKTIRLVLSLRLEVFSNNSLNSKVDNSQGSSVNEAVANAE